MKFPCKNASKSRRIAMCSCNNLYTRKGLVKKKVQKFISKNADKIGVFFFFLKNSHKLFLVLWYNTCKRFHLDKELQTKNDKAKLPLIRPCCLHTHRLCRRGNQCSRLQPDEGSGREIHPQSSLHIVICLHAWHDCNLSVERVWSLRGTIGWRCLHLL